jgi:potassium-transporting ATPase KdpC subunit
VARVARERKVSETTIRHLVNRYTRGRQLGVLGEPVVDVLALNLARTRSRGSDDSTATTIVTRLPM